MRQPSPWPLDEEKRGCEHRPWRTWSRKFPKEEYQRASRNTCSSRYLKIGARHQTSTRHDGPSLGETTPTLKWAVPKHYLRRAILRRRHPPRRRTKCRRATTRIPVKEAARTRSPQPPGTASVSSSRLEAGWETKTFGSQGSNSAWTCTLQLTPGHIQGANAPPAHVLTPFQPDGRSQRTSSNAMDSRLLAA